MDNTVPSRKQSTATQQKTSQLVFKATKIGTPVIIVALFLVFTAASIIVRDVAYPNKYPWKFTAETLLMAFVATFPFMYLIWARTGAIGVNNLLEYAFLIVKFAGLHILFQFAGVYTLLFGESSVGKTA